MRKKCMYFTGFGEALENKFLLNQVDDIRVLLKRLEQSYEDAVVVENEDPQVEHDDA